MALAEKSGSHHGVVVQLVRIPACHAGGRGFEPRPLRQHGSPANGSLQGFFVLAHRDTAGEILAVQRGHIHEPWKRPAPAAWNSSASVLLSFVFPMSQPPVTRRGCSVLPRSLLQCVPTTAKSTPAVRHRLRERGLWHGTAAWPVDPAPTIEVRHRRLRGGCVRLRPLLISFVPRPGRCAEMRSSCPRDP